METSQSQGRSLPTLVTVKPQQKPATVVRHQWSFVDLLAGGAGGMMGAIFTSPLDVVKTRLQSSHYQQASSASRSVAVWSHFRETGRILGNVYRKEGARALFKGLGPNLVGVIPARAINFWAYGNGKRFYTELFGRETTLVHLISAATAGIVTSTVTNPIWVVKTRMQLQTSNSKDHKNPQYRNSFDCTVKILRQEGLRGLYKGLSASYLGVTESTIQWMLYENFKKVIRGYREQEGGDWVEKIGAASAAKLIATTITYPHEVLRTRLRQLPGENGVVKYTGLKQCAMLVVREEGIQALYGGMTAHLMRVVPNAAIMFFVYEMIMQHAK
ncbi:uncharacterized protein VTP21DRAFT_2211 [Calcarisporiella thermophila]|uniref:uncharacterized protein n=1 Tax=Calcarisporiella thermophila TaxID=911321 RepID=UPI0037423EF8